MVGESTVKKKQKKKKKWEAEVRFQQLSYWFNTVIGFVVILVADASLWNKELLLY